MLLLPGRLSVRMANWSSLEWVRLHVISRVTGFAFKFFSFTQNTVNRLSTRHACKLLNKYTLLLRLKKKTISKDKPIRSKNYIWTLANRVNILKGSSSFYKHSFAKRFSLRRHQHVHSPYNVCVMSNISVMRIEELVDWGRLLECKTISSLYAGETKKNSIRRSLTFNHSLTPLDVLDSKCFLSRGATNS